MESERNTLEETVLQFLEKTGCQLVERNEEAPSQFGTPDLVVCCKGWMIGIWWKALESRALEPWHWERGDLPNRYGILLSPDRLELFRNFIRCILAGDVTNAGYNYDLLRLNREEMHRLMR